MALNLDFCANARNTLHAGGRIPEGSGLGIEVGGRRSVTRRRHSDNKQTKYAKLHPGIQASEAGTASLLTRCQTASGFAFDVAPNSWTGKILISHGSWKPRAPIGSFELANPSAGELESRTASEWPQSASKTINSQQETPRQWPAHGPDGDGIEMEMKMEEEIGRWMEEEGRRSA